MDTTPKPRRRRTILLLVAVALLNLPAIAVANHALFTDVPDSHNHAPGIHYVSQAGITSGCSATAYCPGNNLTRGQMATFLHAASGNRPGTPPSVNAASVQGQTPGDIRRSSFLWAYVISNGGIHASSGGVTVEKPATGLYCVIVAKNGGHKAAQATLADPGGTKVVSVGTGHGSACNPHSTSTTDVIPVSVRTTAGAATDGNFTILIPNAAPDPILVN